MKGENMWKSGKISVFFNALRVFCVVVGLGIVWHGSAMAACTVRNFACMVPIGEPEMSSVGSTTGCSGSSTRCYMLGTSPQHQVINCSGCSTGYSLYQASLICDGTTEYYNQCQCATPCTSASNTTSTRTGTESCTQSCTIANGKCTYTGATRSYTDTCNGKYTSSGCSSAGESCSGCSSWGRTSTGTCSGGTISSITCNNGYYKSGNSCVQCQGGYYCTGNTRYNCPANSYCPAGSSSATACSTVSFTDSGSEACTVSNGSGTKTWTRTCYRTTSSQNSDASSDCSGSASCSSKTYSVCNVTQCNTGYSVDSNGRSCVANKYTCSPGYYLSGVSCVKCESGYYCAGGTFTYNGGVQGRSACTSWRANTNTNGATGSTGTSACVCKAGYYLSGSTCTACAKGSYKSANSNATSCTAAGAGYYVSTTGATSRSACSDYRANTDTGVATNSTDASACVCKPGYYLNGSTCTACAKGTYKSISSNTTCLAADSGYYVSTTGATAQSACTSWRSNTNTNGATNSTSTSACVCRAGYYLKGSTCTACDKGTYKTANSNATSCTSADSGYYVSTTGATAQSACTSWRSNTNTNGATGSTSTAACVCKAGYYLKGSTCTACDKGTYKSANSNATSCTSADSGYYVSTTGASSQSACTSWRANTNTNGATGSTSTSACVCKAGYYLNGSTCTACAAGKYKSANSNATSCSNVNANCYTTGTGSTSACPNSCPSNSSSAAGSDSRDDCSCNAGYGGDATTGSCTICSPGYYKSGSGNTSCSNCGTGHYCTGGAHRADCPAGTYGSTVNLKTAACTGSCKAGYYCPAASTSQTQKACGGGKYSAAGAKASTDCKDISGGCYGSSAATSCPNSCPDNSSSPAGSDSRDDCSCNAGAGGDARTGSCTLCAPGYAKASAGNSSCSACTGATYQDGTGKTSCKSCPTATQYASRVTSYWYWSSDGVHDHLGGCRAYITENDDTGNYTLSCAYYLGDYGVNGGDSTCMASDVTSCGAGYYAPAGSGNVWNSTVETIKGTVCVEAGPGYWSAADSLTRTECPAGYAGSDDLAASASQCYKSCSAKTITGGTTSPEKSILYWNGSAYPTCTYIVNCNAKYGAAGNKTANPSCTACTTGQFSAGGTATCATCPANYRSGAAATKQSECKTSCSAGTYVATKNEACTAVGSGYHRAAHTVTYGSVSTRNTCPSGYGKSDAGAASDADCYLTTTKGNYIATKNSATQTKCTANYYCPASNIWYGQTGGRRLCADIGSSNSTGFYSKSAAGAGEASQCYGTTTGGTYIKNQYDGSVTDCPANSYCQGTNVFYGSTGSIASCGGSLTSPAKSDARADCGITCSAGTYLGASGTACSNCTPGNWCGGGAYKFSTSAQGITACGGSLTSNAKATKKESCFVECAAGTYLAKAGTSCATCTANNYCPGATYYYSSAATQGLNACGGDLTSGTGASARSQCGLTCAAGAYLAGGTTSCATCPKGNFCVGGDFNFNANTDQGIEMCPIGRYGATTGLKTSACTDKCAAGYYGASKGQIASTCSGKCQADYWCPAGSTSKTQNACPSTHPDSEEGAGAKDECFVMTTPGKYVADEKGEQVDCLCGAYCPGNAKAYFGLDVETGISYCTAGTYNANTKSEAASACKTTDKGYYAPAKSCSQSKIKENCYGGAGSTTECPNACPAADSGWTAYSPAGSDDYSDCYEYKSGTSISTYCTAGQLRRTASSASAYGTTVTVSTALKAAAGAYVNGQTCTQCDCGYYQPTSGSTVTKCTKTDPGYHSVKGASSQI
ncbi:MAG: hypothetical protein IKJ62_04255, partial [Alphaproteobacteria bacterium]|nr:hypothetical protein [Alphaproteobacteria bacterium]